MITKRVQVTFEVDVTIDETKFDDVFMQEFRNNFFDHDTIDDHIKDLAWNECRGQLDGFVEGYGPIKEMGISAKVVFEECEVIDR